MTDNGSNGGAAGGNEQDAASADIKITAKGDRRTLETIYLELRKLAKENGLEIDYGLSVNRPESQS